MKKMCKNNQKTGFNDIFLKNIEKNNLITFADK